LPNLAKWVMFIQYIHCVPCIKVVAVWIGGPWSCRVLDSMPNVAVHATHRPALPWNTVDRVQDA
jgi:hypothetical protein